MILNFANPIDYLWALLPEIILCTWAMAVLLVDVFQKGSRSQPSKPMIAWLTLAGLAATAVANGWLLTLQEAGVTGMVVVDSFRVFTNFLFLLAGALFVLISTRYLDVNRISLGEVYVLVMLATAGMMVFAGSRDLILIFLGLELMSVAVYVLVGVNRRDPRAAEGALKYFLLGAFSSAFFLFGIALVYGGTGSVNLVLIAQSVDIDGLGASPLVLAGMALLLIGFGFKIAAVPFHMWTPDAYQGAPAPITALMAAAVKAAGFAAFLRVFFTAFPGLSGTWGFLVFWLAVITMITANLIAVVQGNVKRMLAYSSIAHAGYLLVAVAAASELGAASFLFYLVVYTLMTIGAFAVVLIVGREGERNLDLDAYRGLGWERPLLGIAMTIFLLSLAGFPATGGFIGKVFILRAAVETGLVPLAILLVLASLVSYWYYLRVAWYMWFREADKPGIDAGLVVPGPMRVALVTAAVGILLLGIFPGQLLDLAQQSAMALTQAPTLFGRLPGQ